jgi:uncharacterized membrane protein (DUF485 family)
MKHREEVCQPRDSRRTVRFIRKGNATGGETSPDSNNNEDPPMDDSLTQRIASNPSYKELKAKRTSFGWTLTLLMMIAYYGFILLVAFGKEFLSTRIGAGVMTIGIPIGFGVIVFTVLITAFYVRRANSEFDDLTAQITKEALK